MNPVHAWAVKVSRGPVESFESRTATTPGRLVATSTQAASLADRSGPCPQRPGPGPMSQRYVIHLPVVATDLPAAQRLAGSSAGGCWCCQWWTRGRPPSPGGPAVPPPPGVLRSAASWRTTLPPARRPRWRLHPSLTPLTPPDDPQLGLTNSRWQRHDVLVRQVKAGVRKAMNKFQLHVSWSGTPSRFLSLAADHR